MNKGLPTRLALGERLQCEETRVDEFKEIVTHAKVARITAYCYKYINAFLNSEGGNLWFGINDDGVVTGLAFSKGEKKELRDNVDLTLSRYVPYVERSLVGVNFIPVEDLGSVVVVVQVKKGTESVYVADPKSLTAFIKIDGSVYRMSQHLLMRRLTKSDMDTSLVPRLGILGERHQQLERCLQYITKGKRRILVLHGLPETGKRFISLNLVQQYRLTHPTMYLVRLKLDRPMSAETFKLFCIKSVDPSSLSSSDVNGTFAELFKNKSPLFLIDTKTLANVPLHNLGLRNYIFIILTTYYDYNAPLPDSVVERVSPIRDERILRFISKTLGHIGLQQVTATYGFIGSLAVPSTEQADKFHKLVSLMNGFGDKLQLILAAVCLLPASFTLESLQAMCVYAKDESRFMELYNYGILMELDEDRTYQIPEIMRSLFMQSPQFCKFRDAAEKLLFNFVKELTSEIWYYTQTKKASLLVKEVKPLIRSYLKYGLPISQKKIKLPCLEERISAICKLEVQTVLQCVQILLSKEPSSTFRIDNLVPVFSPYCPTDASILLKYRSKYYKN